jgi:hypothetical protein
MNKNRSLVTLSVQRLSEAFKEVCKGKAERNNEILSIQQPSFQQTQEAFREVCKGKQRDLCVGCGKVTEYSRNEPITPRRDFIEGAGQLCSDCFTKTYGPETEEYR